LELNPELYNVNVHIFAKKGVDFNLKSVLLYLRSWVHHLHEESN